MPLSPLRFANRSNDCCCFPQIRKALILPGFCHDGELKTSGRNPDEYFVTGPVEVAIQPFIATGNFPNGTWFNGTVRCVFLFCLCSRVCLVFYRLACLRRLAYAC